ncbi:MAG: HD domain-containing protein [Candidatus Liptonbacteria bacterium]
MNRRSFFGDLLRGLPYGDLIQVQTAYWLAKNAHRYQPGRDNGDRYFEHPRQVAVLLIQRGYRGKDLLTTALLHDVVEDTNTPPNVIVDLFPNIIWEWLYVLSKCVPIFDPVTGQLHDRTKKPLAEYYDAISGACEEVRLVKLADRLHNLKTLDSWDSGRRSRYIAETRQFVLPIAEKTDPWFEEEIKRAIAATEHALRELAGGTEANDNGRT